MSKTLLVFLTLTYSFFTLAGESSINPEKVEYNLFDLRTGSQLRSGDYRVSGINFNHYREDYTHNGTRFEVDLKTYQQAQKNAYSVFKATPGDSSSHFGTAFHVGGNLIFTNQHVLSVSRKNTTSCKRFRIQLNSNQKNKTLYCKEVLYCHKGLDFCLIEMKSHRKGYSLSKQTPPKIKRTAVISDSTRVMSIGNSRGFGLHGATGFGLEHHGTVFKFFAPVFGGNSGGAIFNDAGEVIGVVRSQSKVLYGKEAFNIAITIDYIYNLLLEKLADRPEVLSQINFIN